MELYISEKGVKHGKLHKTMGDFKSRVGVGVGVTPTPVLVLHLIGMNANTGVGVE